MQTNFGVMCKGEKGKQKQSNARGMHTFIINQLQIY